MSLCVSLTVPHRAYQLKDQKWNWRYIQDVYVSEIQSDSPGLSCLAMRLCTTVDSQIDY